jgi:hypothetical protein
MSDIPTSEPARRSFRDRLLRGYPGPLKRRGRIPMGIGRAALIGIVAGAALWAAIAVIGEGAWSLLKGK